MSDEKQLLNQIHEGMRVIDRDHADIGMVDRVYPGDGDEHADARNPGPAVANDAPVLQTDVGAMNVFEVDKLPQEVCERLLNRGFVRLNAPGILAADRYLLPEQIDHVDNKRIVLKVARKDIIKT